MSRILIVEPIALIAEDLAASIRAWDPDAEILTAAAPEAGVDLLSTGAKVDMAFLHLRPEGFADTALAGLLAASNAVWVFMGHSVNRDRDARVLSLDFTFSDTSVADVLALVLPKKRKCA